MLRSLWRVLFVATVLLLVATPGSAAEADPTREAIDKAVEWIYKDRKDGVHWEWDTFKPYPEGQATAKDYHKQRDGQWGGRTALAIYALVSAGEDPRGDRLSPSVDWLLQQEMRGTYGCAMRLLACQYLPQDDRVRRVVAADARTLQAGMITRGLGAGHWDYVVGWIRPVGDTFRYSHSRSQYAILGLDAAAAMGYELPRGLWQASDQGWRRNQRAEGGWGYQHTDSYRPEPTTPGMTASGVATLFLNQRHLIGRPSCNGNLIDPSLAAGLAYLALENDRWLTSKRYDRDFPMATAYAVERVAVASGLRTIGGDDWYSKGRDWLLRTQNSTGSWSSDTDVIAALGGTCFGTLFLARGSSPVVVQKLAHADLEEGRERVSALYRKMGRDGEKIDDGLAMLLSGDWHQRPLDLASMTSFLSKADEMELHWQIVGADRPLEEWLDAPLLVVAGSEPLSLADDVKQKLKDYVHAGGMVYFNADCGSRKFADSVRSLGTELFPTQEWGVVPQTSPLYDSRFNTTNGRVPPMLELGNGVRPFFVLADKADFSEVWQRQATGLSRRNDEPLMQLGANLLSVGIDRANLPRRGTRRTPDVAAPAKTIQVARLTLEGLADAEPRALDGVSRYAAAALGFGIEAADVDATAMEAQDAVVLAGTGDFTLPDAAKDALKTYVENGGMLIVEAVGGSNAFATAAERELAGIFGDAIKSDLARPLPTSHPLYASRGGAELLDPGTIDWKLAAIEALGSNARGPRLRGHEINGRLAIVYSPDDLSSGAAGSMYPMVGYKPAAARELLARVLLYAAEK
jgi:hypothetical protein